VGFLVFVVASLAELTRPPFDMPVADSEIISAPIPSTRG
jgi:NADH:ubiquinone oxidoreductase subunit H